VIFKGRICLYISEFISITVSTNIEIHRNEVTQTTGRYYVIYDPRKTKCGKDISCYVRLTP